jgi:hypothetical protein
MTTAVSGKHLGREFLVGSGKRPTLIRARGPQPQSPRCDSAFRSSSRLDSTSTSVYRRAFARPDDNQINYRALF